MKSLRCPKCSTQIVVQKRPADGKVVCSGCGKTFRLKGTSSKSSQSASSTNPPPTRSSSKSQPSQSAKRSTFVPAKKKPPGPDDLPDVDERPSLGAPETGVRSFRRQAARSPQDGQPLTVERVMDAFTGTVTPPPITLQYRLAVMLVGVVMLILPALYVAVVIIAVLVTAYWAIGFWVTLLSSGSGVAFYAMRRPLTIFVAICLYLGVLVAGVVVTFFLVKPLFIRRPRLELTDGFTREEQPVLFAFCERVADVVGAPRPEVIRSSFDANASAGYAGGFLGLFGGRFELTLGLPLIEGMKLPAVAGILAHEFGHFSQAGGRFFGQAIGLVNGWFTQVAYGRDHWDDSLEDLSHEDTFFWQIVGFAGFLGVALSRLILKLFARIGFMASSLLAKQQEFHADAFQSALVGSDEFSKTMRRIMELQTAIAVTQQHVLDSRDASYLPDDVFRFLTLLADDLPRGPKKKAIRMFKDDTESFFDTHPSLPRRIAAVQKRNESGVFHLDVSARGLFKDIRKTRLDLTNVIYALNFGDLGESTRRSPQQTLKALHELAG